MYYNGKLVGVSKQYLIEPLQSYSEIRGLNIVVKIMDAHFGPANNSRERAYNYCYIEYDAK